MRGATAARFVVRYCLTPLGQGRVSRHAEFAAGIARVFSRGCPWNADDVRQAAYMGLIEAAALFDDAMSLKDDPEEGFRDYAAKFVYGKCKRTLRLLATSMTPHFAHAGAVLPPRPGVVGLDGHGPGGLWSFLAYDPAPPVGRDVEDREEAEAFLAVLGGGCAEVVRLHYFDGVSLAEISSVKGRNKVWARDRKFVALRRMRDRAAEMESCGTYVA